MTNTEMRIRELSQRLVHVRDALAAGLPTAPAAAQGRLLVVRQMLEACDLDNLLAAARWTDQLTAVLRLSVPDPTPAHVVMHLARGREAEPVLELKRQADSVLKFVPHAVDREQFYQAWRQCTGTDPEALKFYDEAGTNVLINLVATVVDRCETMLLEAREVAESAAPHASV